MQITFGPDDKPEHLDLVEEILHEWRKTALTAGRIHPADNPEAGAASVAPLVGGAGPGFVPPAPLTAAVSPSTTAPEDPSVFSAPQTPAPLPPAAPPAPPAVATPVVPLPPASGAVKVILDARGLPWDGRLHASTKRVTQGGTWQAKKGLNDASMVARIEAELVGTVAHLAPENIERLTPGGVASVASVEAPQAPVVPVAPTAAEAPPAPAAPQGMTFPDLMKKAMPLVNSQKLTAAMMLSIAQTVGAANWPGLMHLPNKIQEASDLIDAYVQAAG